MIPVSLSGLSQSQKRVEPRAEQRVVPPQGLTILEICPTKLPLSCAHARRRGDAHRIPCPKSETAGKSKSHGRAQRTRPSMMY